MLALDGLVGEHIEGGVLLTITHFPWRFLMLTLAGAAIIGIDVC